MSQTIAQELTFILSADDLFEVLKQGGNFSFGFALNVIVDYDGKVWTTISVAERKGDSETERIELRGLRGKAVPTPPGGHGGTIDITPTTKTFFDSLIPSGGKTLTEFNNLLSR